ncbi:Signal recognition particle receptor FtsY [Candidatus Terasakiella magnetica]|uniref:Signal recognition particle receptor FtsY n=1 Tax=Candidatus Terasakiella magnetica TaxID=1867952 RepID=A0A1C3RGZ8_9PROT|nr:signal recognition particle-docking protein FtsY [Candidatus Terasakiella magnetica]SCA56474.1 Signal recognition particle receptor FtsY [Candidatus Terasakiella magnetica]
MTETDQKGWMSRLKEGLSKSSDKLTGGVFTKKKLDEEALEDLEDTLIMSDMGLESAAKIVKGIAKTRFGKDLSDQELKAAIAEEIEPILEPVNTEWEINVHHKPHVVLVCGVNGSGKTTSIGKIAGLFKQQDLKVMLAAGDTFRAAAVEQLKVWGERAGVPVVAKETGADAPALAFDAVKEAQKQEIDVLLIDTAGRLQNKSHLMDELEKIVRVIKKVDESAPHDTILVLDAGVGQNAHSQVELFDKVTNVTGIILTKLDGTAKGGIAVSLAEKFNKPIFAIGVGEGAEDLQPFDAKDYTRALVGLNEEAGE